MDGFVLGGGAGRFEDSSIELSGFAGLESTCGKYLVKLAPPI